MSACGIGTCDEPRTTTHLCSGHAQRLVDDPDWMPVRLADGEAFCGFCDRQISPRRRNGEPDPRLYYLELPAHPEGKCAIEGGGFVVFDQERIDRARHWGEPPLYRTHPPVCPGRATAAGVPVDSETAC